MKSETFKLCIRESWQCAIACAVLSFIAGLAITFAGNDDIVWDAGKVIKAIALILLIILPTMLITGMGAALVFWALIFWSKLFSYRNRKKTWGTPRTPNWTLGIVIALLTFLIWRSMGYLLSNNANTAFLFQGILFYINYLIVFFYYLFGSMIWENIWNELISPNVVFDETDSEN